MLHEYAVAIQNDVEKLLSWSQQKENSSLRIRCSRQSINNKQM